MTAAQPEPDRIQRHNQFALLRERRFAPFFWTQFAGAANDNLFKFALTVLVTYQLNVAWLPPALAGVAIGALFILPFVLFSATSGQLADKFDKATLMRVVKNLEIAIMALAAWAFMVEQVPVLLACVFLMGLHSTLFGPVKYAYLPQVLDERELTGGNGMVEAGTFVAILLGNVAGGLLVALPQLGHGYVAAACVALALAGRMAAQRIPPGAGHRPRSAHLLESFSRNLAQPEAGAFAGAGVPFAAGHFVDVVLRRHVFEQFPGLCQGGAARQRAGGVAAAGGVFGGHRDGIAVV